MHKIYLALEKRDFHIGDMYFGNYLHNQTTTLIMSDLQNYHQ